MSKNKYPLVSVVIPVYNNVLWLEEAVDSVLKQDYPNIEIIVVNDGSSESFEPFLNRYANRIRYYFNENRGVAYARNFGINQCLGDYIAFLDSDDLWMPNKISSQIKYMLNKNIKWSQHDYEYFNDEDKMVLKKINTSSFQGDITSYIFTSCFIQTSCIVVEKSVLENNPEIRFDENKRYGEDLVFYLQLAQKYELGYIDKVLTLYRIRGANAGKNVAVQIEYRSNVYKEFNCLSVYRNNTNFCTKIGYLHCYIVNKYLPNVIKKNRLGTKIMYTFPWVIFKMSYYGLSVKRKMNR